MECCTLADPPGSSEVSQSHSCRSHTAVAIKQQAHVGTVRDYLENKLSYVLLSKHVCLLPRGLLLRTCYYETLPNCNTLPGLAPSKLDEIIVVIIEVFVALATRRPR